jgi:hypothetical protein
MLEGSKGKHQMNTNTTYRSILQNLVCDRYADKDEARASIDLAFEDGALTAHQVAELNSHLYGTIADFEANLEHRNFEDRYEALGCLDSHIDSVPVARFRELAARVREAYSE